MAGRVIVLIFVILILAVFKIVVPQKSHGLGETGDGEVATWGAEKPAPIIQKLDRYLELIHGGGAEVFGARQIAPSLPSKADCIQYYFHDLSSFFCGLLPLQYIREQRSEWYRKTPLTSRPHR